ncbi:hypothetical protein HYPSUDRAFT_602568 [Hypholoma sublateritium FD-334 SS-4]|uniref:Cytochrome P450 n=1 Tax=Hypholoma sublateritium (strain FD-334 SS-4) TaxID=945553 RepID=A0A0D2P345_HYPSF|nr:hypothetical protein HYPSUDRAFT_602568 [Hypholoma sublateritium FD-334 SS-4]
MSSELTLAILTLSIVSVCVWALKSPQRLPYPPGPPPTSFIAGNMSDISTPNVWRKYTEWTKQYGNIIYLRIFGQPIVILNSLEDALELLERRSGYYSSRPVVPMYEIMEFSSVTTLRAYGPEWRTHRKVFQQAFKPDSCMEYRPIQIKKVYDMLNALLQTPERVEAHSRRYAGSIISSVVYGYDIVSDDDPLVELVESTEQAFTVAPLPKWLVNGFPFLRHIPSWFPGAGFKRYALSIRHKWHQQVDVPFKYTITASESLGGSHTPVVLSLLNGYTSEEDNQMLKEALGSAYSAGVGTTASSIVVFLIAMVTYPQICKRAQDDIDRVTGGQRLPDYGDLKSLPYIQAIIREVLRWRPITPLGITHVNDKDDVYNGYYIPKGSIIYSNIWAMSRDPIKYKDPEVFNPDRFLTEAGELNGDEVSFAFGFGRRICPGRHLTVASIWLAAAVILASFDVEQKKDSSGSAIPLGVKFNDEGVVCTPAGLLCSITPRSEKARQIILEGHRDVF